MKHFTPESGLLGLHNCLSNEKPEVFHENTFPYHPARSLVTTVYLICPLMSAANRSNLMDLISAQGD